MKADTNIDDRIWPVKFTFMVIRVRELFNLRVYIRRCDLLQAFPCIPLTKMATISRKVTSMVSPMFWCAAITRMTSVGQSHAFAELLDRMVL